MYAFVKMEKKKKALYLQCLKIEIDVFCNVSDFHTLWVFPQSQRLFQFEHPPFYLPPLDHH